MNLDRQTIISELILAGADRKTIELAKADDIPLCYLQEALALQKNITRRVILHYEHDAVTRQLAMRSRK